jgi:glycosyltransferase involved in cell wall biosynthesis
MHMSSKTGEKPKILILCNFYLPGYKAGGGLRTVVHMVERLNDRFDFFVITQDHDGDGVPYSSVKINEWNEIAGAKVFYLAKENVRFSKLSELIAEIEPQAIYLNSVFAKFTVLLLILRKLKRINEIPVILAPEGELSDGALQLKAAKKKAFIKFAKAVNLYKNLIWKATADPEKLETERFKGSGGQIFIAPNMPSNSIFEDYQQELKPEKNSGEAKMIFLSRYGRKKNFKWLVDNLHDVKGKLKVDIVGPLEDESYWNETQLSISSLPTKVKVQYKGHVSHEQVLETLFKYHFFVLPTLGENFGHVFIEALSAGCPLIISDRTPWTGLQDKRVGWDLPLEQPQKWVEILNYCISLDNVNYQELSASSRKFACHWLADPETEESTLRVLQFALQKTSVAAG